MTRLCERPGCSAPASCSYGIDTTRLRVWIDALATVSTPAIGPRAGALCRRHADAMVVPRGWHVDDRRAVVAIREEPRSAQPPPPSVPGAPPAGVDRGDVDASPAADSRSGRRRLRRARQPDGPQPEQLVLLDVAADSGVLPVGQSPDGSDGTSIEPSPATAAVDGDTTDQTAAIADAAESSPTLVDENTADPVAEPGISSGPDRADDPAGSDESPVDATPIAPWRPVFDHADDLGGVLHARSPLLARAFGRRIKPAASPAPHERGSDDGGGNAPQG